MTKITTSEITEWIDTYLIPKISKTLGKSSEKVHRSISFPENAFYISGVYFLELSFESEEKSNGNEGEHKLSLVVKRQPMLDDVLAKKVNMAGQFHNEIVFYTKIANGNPRFPLCIFAAEDPPDNTVIVIENIIPKGYALCPQAYDIPVEYVFSAINEIARFHGMAYVMKEQEPEKFNKIVSEVPEPRFGPCTWMKEFIDIVAVRPILWLREKNYDAEFCDKLSGYFDNAYDNMMVPALKTVEPLAVLCHGDFTRNNVFFRRVDGKLEAMLLDFAGVSYASFATDLSTFLYLNCSDRDRVEKFDAIFKSYHDTLISYMRDAGMSDLEKYSYDKMLAEYKRLAPFGYIVAIYFLPVLREPHLVDITIIRDDHKEGARRTLEMGGEAMGDILGEMLLELRDMGSFDHVCQSKNQLKSNDTEQTKIR